MGSKPTLDQVAKMVAKVNLLVAKVNLFVGDNLPNREGDLLYEAMSHDPTAIKYISG